MLANKTFVIAIAAALSATLAAPLAIAENFRPESRTVAQSEIAKRLDDFESAAAALQKQADHYAASVRANHPQRETHALELSYAKQQVNSLGRQLATLEQLSPEGTKLQQAAIREARPHLQAVADHVENAIVMLNGDQFNHRSPEFAENVKGIYEHADDLHTKVDAITDYEKASDRTAAMNPLAES
jgi:chromosome segregation ATPase